ncbi:hypothetical protein [Curtobacterium sp. AB7]
MRDRDDPDLDDLEWVFEDFIEDRDTIERSTPPASPRWPLSRRRR